MPLFGSSGVRKELDPALLDLVFKISVAVGLRYQRVIVGGDTRTSSDLLKHIAIAGLGSAGARVFDAGILPTPTLAFAARKFDCSLMVTASHNPPEYNGVKLLNPDGSAFSPKQQREIEEMISGSPMGMAKWENIENCVVYHGAIEQHIHHIRKSYPQKYSLKVVVDCACGAASGITPKLLQTMGCQVLALNSNPSGFFPHPVEPLEENLTDLKNAVIESKADLGIAHDGDADRMMGVDEIGRFINGDKMLCLLATAVKAQAVVSTIDASMILEKQGFHVGRTQVGDSFVSEELKKGGEFGGEPSGAWIFPKNTFCPDGIFAAACLVDLASREKLSPRINAIPDLPIRRSNVKLYKNTFEKHIAELVSFCEPSEVNMIDGIKLMFPEGWVLVRASGTEPKVRVTVEGLDDVWVREIHEKVLQMIKGWA